MKKWQSKKQQKDTHAKKVGPGDLDSPMEKLQHPETRYAYHIQLDKEAGLLHTADRKGVPIT